MKHFSTIFVAILDDFIVKKNGTKIKNVPTKKCAEKE